VADVECADCGRSITEWDAVRGVTGLWFCDDEAACARNQADPDQLIDVYNDLDREARDGV